MSKSQKPSRQSQESRGIDAELGALREKIDEVDRDVLAALNRRAELVSEVGALKSRGDSPVYVASRERDLVAKLVELNPGPFPSAGIPHVFREVISATRV